MKTEMPLLKKSVVEWLSLVNYRELDRYVPGVFAIHFVNFIKLVNGGKGEENQTPPLHYKMIDQIGSGHTRIANMVHRGAAKTTVFGEYLFLYVATYGELPVLGKVDLAIYVSDSMDNGVKNMRKNLEFRYTESAFLQKVVPFALFTDSRWEFKNENDERFIVKGYGAMTGVRGTKELGKRPQLAVLDDLVSDEDARSEAAIRRIESTIYNAVDYALHPTNNLIIWSGTPYNQRDPLYKAIESGAWAVNVFPVCEKFPCTKEEFAGSWEDRFTYEYVKKKYEQSVKDHKLASFNQELMLKIMSDDERVIEDDDIRWYYWEDIKTRLGNYNIYITTDFATKDTARSDLSCISVWAVSYDKRFFYIDGIARKQGMDANVRDLFKFAQKYNPMGVGVEANGQQAGFVAWIMEEMVRRNVFFTLASNPGNKKPGIINSGSKLSRFDMVVPWFKDGRFYLPKDRKDSDEVREAVNELELVTVGGFRSKYDDWLDTVSMLASMVISPPSQHEDMSYDSGVWSSRTFGDDSGSSYNSYVV